MKPHNKFKENFTYYLRKYLLNHIFVIAVLLNVYFMFTGCELFEDKVTDPDLLGGLQGAFILGWGCFASPVLLALPYTARFHEEKSSGAYRFGLIRAGKLRYVCCKLRDSALSGALVMACSLPLFIAALFVYAFSQGGRVTLCQTGMFGNEYTPTFYYELIVNGRGIVVFLINCLFLLGFGMFWSCMGTVISFFTKNKRLAIAGPFILQRITDYIIPDSLSFLNEHHLMLDSVPQAMYLGGIPYVVCYVSTAFVLGVTILYFGMEAWLQRHG